MLFKDKLEFLIKLTMTTNRQLAKEIKTDPSFVSRLRRGARGIPHNKDSIREMADFFAKRCDSDFQRAGIAEAMGRPELRLMGGTEQLGQIIFDWMLDEDGSHDTRVGQFLGDFSRFAVSAPPEDGAADDAETRYDDNYIYYGNKGRRAAVGDLLKRLLTLEEPKPLLVTSDESTEWILESPHFSAELNRRMLQLANKGFCCRHIAHGIKNADAAFDSLMRWMPMYLAGKAESFYYPRIRDDVYHRTLIAVPGAAALVSTSVGYQVEAGLTFLTFDKNASCVFAKEFDDFLAKCRPMMSVYTEPRQFGLCAQRFEAYDGMCFRRIGTLPVTLPGVGERVFACGEGMKVDGALWRDLGGLFEKNIIKNRCVDVIRLETPERIREGDVPMAVPPDASGGTAYYSVERYCEHLRLVLECTERYENYSVVVEEGEPDGLSAVYVKDGSAALLIRRAPPFAIFETTEMNLVGACMEYVSQLADSPLSRPLQKKQAQSRMRALLSELESGKKE